MAVSALVLTYNEEKNLPGCLKALAWCDDVVVFDSYSTDRTVEIARAAGARVFQRRFDNYAGQREAARQVAYKNPWVLAVDADERPDSLLVEEVLALGATPLEAGRPVAYRLRRKDFMLGKWIRHSTLYPSWFIRLYRPDHIHYEPRAVHEYPSFGGTLGALHGHLIHHSFNKGLHDWIAKHNGYAVLEAQEALKVLAEGGQDWAGLACLDPIRRRRALKRLSARMPLRPLLRFLYMYILRLGILDGAAGYSYCRLLAFYEYLIVLNIRERQLAEKGGGF